MNAVKQSHTVLASDTCMKILALYVIPIQLCAPEHHMHLPCRNTNSKDNHQRSVVGEHRLVDSTALLKIARNGSVAELAFPCLPFRANSPC